MFEKRIKEAVLLIRTRINLILELTETVHKSSQARLEKTLVRK